MSDSSLIRVLKSSVLMTYSSVAMPEVASFETLSAEIGSLKRHLLQIDSPVVLCHNDLLTKNIIYNQKEGEEQIREREGDLTNYLIVKPNIQQRNSSVVALCRSENLSPLPTLTRNKVKFCFYLYEKKIEVFI